MEHFAKIFNDFNYFRKALHLRCFTGLWIRHYFAPHLPLNFRSSHQRCSVRKDVLRNFAKITGKHLRQSLLAQGFSYEFCEISKHFFFKEHLWATASKTLSQIKKKPRFCEIVFQQFFKLDYFCVHYSELCYSFVINIKSEKTELSLQV